MVLAADHFIHAGGEAKDFSLQSRLMKHFRHAHILYHHTGVEIYLPRLLFTH